MPALAFAIQLLGSLPSLVQAGIDITTLVSDGTSKLQAFKDEKRDPTPAEWDALNARIDALREELHK